MSASISEHSKETLVINNRRELMRYLSILSTRSSNNVKLPAARVELQDFDIEPGVEQLVSARFAELYRAVPLMLYEGCLAIAVADDTNLYESLKNIEFITAHHVEAFSADSHEIDQALSELYNAEDLIGLSQSIDVRAIEQQQSVEELRKQIEEKPLVKLVHRIIHEAIKKEASDIHIRPSEDKIDYLLRIDGNMTLASRFDRRYLGALISRFKIIGGMDISEHRLPQDGGAKLSIQGRTVEVRMSVIPTIHGESLVVRLLNTDVTLFKMEQLPFSERDYDVILRATHQSNGLILVTGPTGSGKSTTLYALLQEIKKNANLNIMTVEDPVEFHIDGVEQIQVNRKTDFTFARALRNILRHDPDVIMIGEIRDEETAKIAIECALTGHLVLSTLHSVDAVSTVTRLLEMGVKPYLLKATLSCVIAQRLAKLNCPHCLGEDVSPLASRISTDKPLQHVHWKQGKGCEDCHKTGLKGRQAIFEVLQINQEISSIIREGVTEDEILRAAQGQNMADLATNAIALAEQGLISAEEFVRLKIS